MERGRHSLLGAARGTELSASTCRNFVSNWFSAGSLGQLARPMLLIRLMRTMASVPTLAMALALAMVLALPLTAAN